MANRLKAYLRGTLRELCALPTTKLVEGRYEKFRRMGIFLEAPAEPAAVGAPDAHSIRPPHQPPETSIIDER
jgi:hypothetical protein